MHADHYDYKVLFYRYIESLTGYLEILYSYVMAVTFLLFLFHEIHIEDVLRESKVAYDDFMKERRI